ncbi:cytochrome P450 [Rhypophila decipiens]|uniref:Cytochrome P450 n=1 Tax=Rhypophila decipiens TaxID=261697 RepID=A0AAN6XUR0_9PEZI|nr:cytochrome P450 [Rhypophila decipiens]
MLREILYELPFFSRVSLVLAWFLGLWRFWMFTLKPLVRPSDPKVLPHWIPCHTFSFFRSSDKVLEYGLNYMGRTREIFALQIMGKKLYIVTDPADVTAVFQNREGLSFDGHLARLLKNFGVRSEALKRGWHKPEPGDWCYIPSNPINPQQLDLIHFVEAAWKKQLAPGQHEAKLCQAFLSSVGTSLWFGGDGLLDYTTIPSDDSCSWCGKCTSNTAEGGKEHHKVLLYSLCRESIVEAITRSLFGDHLHNINPDIVENMIKFNEHVWMVVFDYGAFFETPVSKPQKSLMDTLIKFIQTPPQRRGREAWVIKNMLAAMETTDIDVYSRASMLLMCFWAAVSNEYNTAFWILATLLYDENLMRLVEKETAAAWKPGEMSSSGISGSNDSEQLDIKYLCSNSPQLSALFYETLRLRNGAAALREVTKPTVIGGKMLQPGSSVMIPFRQLHLNEHVWGSTAHEFDATRFLKNEGLARHPSFRPFGGGKTLCPGKLMGMEQVFGFVAILLRRFEIKLAATLRQDMGMSGKACSTPEGAVVRPPFPRINDAVPSLGISGPVAGTDVVVEMRTRVNNTNA